MGIPASSPVSITPASRADRANFAVTGSITGTGTVGPWMIYGPFNVMFGGSGGPNGSYSATIQLERSFDGGTTWYVAGVGGSGAQAVYATPNQDVSLVVLEPEAGVLYRLRCTVYTSGTINYRISGNGAAAMSLGSTPGVF
jgi:hypothetical protein